MKLATTTGDFERVCPRHIDRVRHVYEAGFRYVDLSMYAVEKDDALIMQRNWQKSAEEIQEFMADRNMEFVQAHSPSGNLMKSEADLEIYVQKTIRAIEVCGFLQIPNLVVHTGWREGATKEEWFRENRDFIRRLFPYMEKCNVNLLHENGTRKTIPWFYLKSGKAMREFSEYVNHPLFHSCWDTGHALLEGEQYKDICTLGNDLYGVHIHDNRGEKDEHIAPFLGVINMAEIMHGLIDAGYKGAFVFEAESTLRPGEYWVGNRRTFEKDDRLFQPSLKLQKAMESFLYGLGEYILKTYDLFEE